MAVARIVATAAIVRSMVKNEKAEDENNDTDGVGYTVNPKPQSTWMRDYELILNFVSGLLGFHSP